MTLTMAPGTTAPPESATVPSMLPVDWAHSIADAASRSLTIRAVTCRISWKPPLVAAIQSQNRRPHPTDIMTADDRR